MIRIEVPATSANLGSGFDSLGIALTKYNQVWMEEADYLEIQAKDDVKIPTDENNLIFWAAKTLYEQCGRKLSGVKIIQQNNIPMARGLGSSSACIVAGILGANHLLGNPLSQQDLINLAAQIEGHPDNTTPALLGGLVASAMEGDKVYNVSVPVSNKIRFVVFIPGFELKTEKARSVLPNQYSKQDAVYNLSRSALMAATLFSGKIENLRVAVQDRLHQPYRIPLIKNCEQIFQLSYDLGSLGTYISGAGPTMIAMVSTDQAEKFLVDASRHFVEKGISNWSMEILNANASGANVVIE